MSSASKAGEDLDRRWPVMCKRAPYAAAPENFCKTVHSSAAVVARIPEESKVFDRDPSGIENARLGPRL